MMYRDEWLEPAETPLVRPQPVDTLALSYARVRPLQEIQATLDVLGRRDHLMFMPEMARYAGARFRIERRIERVLEHGQRLATPGPIYILEGLRCTGDVLGADGPCDRACHLLWHADWLVIESP